MKKSVFFVLCSSLVISLAAAFPAGAEYFDIRWYDRVLKARSKVIFPDKPLLPGTIDTEDAGKEGGGRLVPFGLPSPPMIKKPVKTVTDSIDIANNRVRRINSIPGLRVENYYFISFDDFFREHIENTNSLLWEKERKKRMNEWTVERTGGVSDLDFVLPVGKRFEGLIGGKTNVRIDGQQRIEFSGKSEYDEGVIETATTKNTSFPSLTMKQEPRFSIQGNVGDRITVDIKQDTQTGSLSNMEENISLKYKGKEHDIIKNIEAGNTSLNLKGATFSGYTGSHRGLFGIRTEAQLGPVEITAIASQEKSESNAKSFKGKAEEATLQIRDYNYKSNTYFFIDALYKNNFELYRDSLDRILYDPADSLAVFEVYIDDGIDTNDTREGTYAYPGIAWPMNMESGDENPDAYVEGYFHRADPRDYYIDRSLGFIQFGDRVPDEWTVGVNIVTRDGREFGKLGYNAEDPTTRNVFKLIKRKGQRPTDTDTWNLEWKNVYDLGQRNIDMDGLEIRIYREATDGVSRDKQNGIPYIQILGIDKVDENGNPTPDNKVDFNRGFVNPFRGELIFPILRPFDPEERPSGVTVDLQDRVPQIYDVYNMQEKQEASKYYIEVKTANRQQSYRIGEGMGGILENSESVVADGRKLVKGTDYRINYMTGEITIINDEISSTADIDIKYQEAAAFQEMQKSLFGVRADYNLLSESRIGGVFLFNNESTKEKRVRLGSEPSRMMLFDVDTDLNFRPAFVTKAVDMLPLIVASRPSSIRIQGEIAQSLPTLNTHGEVTIDDFEGSQNTPMSITRTNWTTASPPDPATGMGMRLKNRGRLQWYNPWDRTRSEDIWPNKETSAGENTVHVLTLAYGKAEGVADDESFAGVMSAFWGTGIDLSRARYIEVWVRGGKGELKIDLGSISEDFFPLEAHNGLLDTEDIPIPGQGHGDGVLTEEEDTGLDNLFSRSEPGYGPDNHDPNHDNWGYNPDNKNDYSRINGTEGNARDSDVAGVPDTEDLNHNGILDSRNIYYEYSISLENPFDEYLVEDSVPSGDPAGWRLFRIPLWNNISAIQDGTEQKPDSTLIEFSRLWITDTDSTIVQIASMEIVESNWLEKGVFDADDNDISGDDPAEQLRISNKNSFENLDYTSPPGVKGEFNRDKKIRQKEQSIVIEVENLAPGHTGYIYRNFEKMDFTDYSRLKMFVHGPNDSPSPGKRTSDYELVVQFGGDRNNYYEYRSPIYRGWAKENDLDIDLATCTNLKLLPEYGISDTVSVVDSVGAKIYTLKGKPSLNNIKIISIGFKNNQEVGGLTNEVWLNELRLDNLRDMSGTAFKTSLNADLSGFISIIGNVSKQNSDFHGMNAKKGTGNDDMKWSTQIEANLDQFTPKRWNLNVRTSISLDENEALPRLKSGSDIVLPEDRKKDYRTYGKNKKFRFSYKKQHDETKKGVTGLVTRWAFEKVSAEYNWGDNNTISPSRGTAMSTNQQLMAVYDIAPVEKGFVFLKWMPELPTALGKKISNAKFNYTPNTMNYNYTFNQKSDFLTDIEDIREAPTRIKTSKETINMGYRPFGFIKYDYKLDRDHDLFLKKEVKYTEGNRLSLEGPEILNITNKYNYDLQYEEDNNPKYSLSSQLGSRTVQFRKTFSATADFALNKLLEEKLSGKPRPAQSTQERDPNRPTWGSLFPWIKKGGGKDTDTEGGSKERTDEQKENNTDRKNDSEPEPAKKDGEATPGHENGDKGEEGRESPPAEPEKIEPPDSVETDRRAPEDGTSREKLPERTIEQPPSPNGKKPPAPGETGKNDTKREPVKKDEEKLVEEKVKEAEIGAEVEKKGEGIRTKIVMAISRSVSPISLEYREGEQLNYSGLTDRPGFMARLGQEPISPPDTSSVMSSRNTSAITQTYNARTSIQFPLNIQVRTTGKIERARRISSSVNEREEGATYPEISLSWPNFDKQVPFVKNYFSNMNITSTYAVTKSKNWQNDNPEPKTDRTEKRYSPLFSISAKVIKRVDLSFSLNNTRQTTYDVSGEVRSMSLVDTGGTTTTLRYSLTPQKLPFFRSSKVRSAIDLSGEFKTNLSTTQRQVGNERIAKIQETQSNSISFGAEYRFSQKFRGGSTMMFSSTKDITKKVHKVNEVTIWCELKF